MTEATRQTLHAPEEFCSLRLSFKYYQDVFSQLISICIRTLDPADYGESELVQKNNNKCLN